MLRKILLIIIAFLPRTLKRWALISAFDYKLDPTARIGLSFIDAQIVVLGPGSRIGSFCAIRNLVTLSLGENAKLGTFNLVFGMAANSYRYFAEEIARRSSLMVGDHAATTSRHLVDCIDSVSIDPFTTIAGFRSQLLTHSIDIGRNCQSCALFNIGAYCFIGTGVIILKGVTIPGYTIVAAGSVVAKSLPASRAVYGGNPAAKLKDTGTDVSYFSRDSGNVD